MMERSKYYQDMIDSGDISRKQFEYVGGFLQGFAGNNLPGEIIDSIIDAIRDIGDCDIYVISHKTANKINIPLLVECLSENQKEVSMETLDRIIAHYMSIKILAQYT